MNITSDWHIHTRNSCDSACLTVSDLISEAAQSGIHDFGITDHLHTPYNLPDIARARDEFLANDPSPHFHFGVEASCMSQWEIDEIAANKYKDPVYGLRSGGKPGCYLDDIIYDAQWGAKPGCALALGITAENIAQFGIEYVIGGTHWPLFVPLAVETLIPDYHRQNMFLASHPLVDIIAHPWWGLDGLGMEETWDFGLVPKSMHDEFAAAVLEHNKVVEINIGAGMLFRNGKEQTQYLEFLAQLKMQGVHFSIASDCHGVHYDVTEMFERASKMLARVGIADDFWCLPPRTDRGTQNHRMQATLNSAPDPQRSSARCAPRNGRLSFAPRLGSSALRASEPTDGAAYSPDNRRNAVVRLRRAHPAVGCEKESKHENICFKETEYPRR